MNQPQLKCPRCGTMNPKNVDACIACGFARSKKTTQPSNKISQPSKDIQYNPAKIRGTVSGKNEERIQLANGINKKIIKFKIDQFDPSTGNLIKSFPVEMSGNKIDGYIDNGNDVEFIGKLKSTGYIVKKLWNYTTSTEVKIKSGWNDGIGCVLSLIVGVLIVSGIALCSTSQSDIGSVIGWILIVTGILMLIVINIIYQHKKST